MHRLGQILLWALSFQNQSSIHVPCPSNSFLFRSLPRYCSLQSPLGLRSFLRITVTICKPFQIVSLSFRALKLPRHNFHISCLAVPLQNIRNVSQNPRRTIPHSLPNRHHVPTKTYISPSHVLAPHGKMKTINTFTYELRATVTIPNTQRFISVLYII